mmetsp:Transcript_68502/g.198727  ORF Transcript_68502/g.198727 Transcript_68502/m.198727 type:complete len:850 (-) Transcript_68502:51-2600(-)
MLWSIWRSLPRLDDYIDEDEPFGFSESMQIGFAGCCCCFNLASFIAFAIVIGGFRNLLPEDQLIVYKGRERTAVNGPGSLYVSVTTKTTMRKALKLDATEWATIRDTKTNQYYVKSGPIFEHLGPWEDVFRNGSKTRLAYDEFVRIIDVFTGVEKIIRGPQLFTPNVSDQGPRTHIVVEKALMLTKEVGIIVRDRSTAEMTLTSTCSETPGPFFPTPTRDIVETRKRLHVAPHEAVLVQDIDGKTKMMNGANPPATIEGNCDNTSAANQDAGGVAFFLPPLSRVVRMKWSDYSKPPENVVGLTTTPVVTSTTRRRRSSRSRVVLAQEWDIKPKTWLVAGDYDTTTGLWVNRGTGANLTNIVRAGSVTVSATAANAPTAQLMALVGAASTKLELGNLISSSKWTICSLTRYTGGAKRSIIAGPYGWAHGHYAGFAGVARYGYNRTDMIADIVRPDTEWVPMCGTSGSAPENVVLYDEKLGKDRGESFPNTTVTETDIARSRPNTVYVNGDPRHVSDFAIAEIIVWNEQLKSDEVAEAMDYLRARLLDASTYIDQAGSDEFSLSGVEKKDVTNIDLRTQKSFFKFQARTGDNVRMVLEGSVFWQVEDPAKTLATTADPEGDVWSKARSIILEAVSSVAFKDFLSTSSDVMVQAFENNRNLTFWTERGLRLVSLELAQFDPTDAKTIADLRSIIAQKVARIVKLTKQTSDSEVRKIAIDADIALESNRTALIEVKAENDRLEAETRGATEGGRKAQGVAAFLTGLATLFPGSPVPPVELYEHYIILRSLEKQAKTLFNGRPNIFITSNVTNISLLLPAGEAPALPPPSAASATPQSRMLGPPSAVEGEEEEL